MSRKDYERAAEIAQFCVGDEEGETAAAIHASVVDSFVELFKGDNGRFDEDRFRRACVPGANVKARG